VETSWEKGDVVLKCFEIFPMVSRETKTMNRGFARYGEEAAHSLRVESTGLALAVYEGRKSFITADVLILLQSGFHTETPPGGQHYLNHKEIS
jgi:hypothetical protein